MPLGSVIPLEKIIVGKPIQLDTPQYPDHFYGAGNGYVDPKTLSSFFQKAKTEIGWNTGLMIWEYVPDSDDAKNYLNVILGGQNSVYDIDNKKNKDKNKDNKIDFINIFIYVLLFILVCVIIYKFIIKNKTFLTSSKLYKSKYPEPF
jgi:hypothetical protein